MNKGLVWVFSLLLLTLTVVVSAQQEQNQQWSPDYVRTHPSEAFTSDPDRAVAAYPDLLLDPGLAQQYFSSAGRMNENNIDYYLGLLRTHPEFAVANIDVFKRALSVDPSIVRQLPEVYESAIDADISVVNENKDVFHDYVLAKTQGKVDLVLEGDLTGYEQGRIRTAVTSCMIDQLQILSDQGIGRLTIDAQGTLRGDIFGLVGLKGDIEVVQGPGGAEILQGTAQLNSYISASGGGSMQYLPTYTTLNDDVRLLIRNGRPLALILEKPLTYEVIDSYGVIGSSGNARRIMIKRLFTTRGLLEIEPGLGSGYNIALGPLPGQQDAEFGFNGWSVKVADVTDIAFYDVVTTSERSAIAFDFANRRVHITSRNNNLITADLTMFEGGPRLIDVDSRQGEVVLIDFAEGVRRELTMDGLEVRNSLGLPSFAVRVNQGSPEGHFIHPRSGIVALDQCDQVNMCREYLTAIEAQPRFRQGASDIARLRGFLEREGRGVEELEATVYEGDEADRLAAMNFLALMDTPQSREAVHRIAERVIADLKQGTRQAYVQWVAERARFIEAVQEIGLYSDLRLPNRQQDPQRYDMLVARFDLLSDSTIHFDPAFLAQAQALHAYPKVGAEDSRYPSEVRQQIALILQTDQGFDAIAAELVRLDPDFRVRRVLAARGTAAAYYALRDADPQVIRAGIDAFSLLGPDAASAILEIARQGNSGDSERERLREQAMQALVRMGSPNVLSEVLATARDEEMPDEVRADAIRAMGGWGQDAIGQAAGYQLRQLFERTDSPILQQELLVAIHRLQGEGAWDFLTEVTGVNPPVTGYAEQLLETARQIMEGPQAPGPVITPEARQTAERLLDRTRQDAFAQTLSLLTSPDTEVIQATGERLQEIDAGEFQELLEVELTSPDSQRVLNALNAYYEFSLSPNPGVLGQALNNPDQRVRTIASQLAASPDLMAQSRVRALAQTLTGHTDPQVSGWAKSVISQPLRAEEIRAIPLTPATRDSVVQGILALPRDQQLGVIFDLSGEDAIPAFSEVMSDPDQGADIARAIYEERAIYETTLEEIQDIPRLQTFISVLGQVHSPAVIPILEQAARHTDPYVRSRSLHALSQQPYQESLNILRSLVADKTYVDRLEALRMAGTLDNSGMWNLYLQIRDDPSESEDMKAGARAIVTGVGH